MKSRFAKIGLPVLALLAGLMAVQASGLFEQPRADDGRQFSQQVNLAMRQAADRLLDLSGDSTGTIPPVEEVSPGEYLLRLENNFNYDSLPAYLEAALTQFSIEGPYYVTVNDCLNNLLMLGYSHEALTEGQTPCGGREQRIGCYNLTLVFPDRRLPANPTNWAWLWVTVAVAAAAAMGYALKSLKNSDLRSEATTLASSEPTGMRFGNTHFDPANLAVHIGGASQQLTFREAKLLQYFAERPNQVLEREAILAAVWEDEGIIVGRSLDVFVSRLRKILQPDPSVKIANVHGVGYRLEVTA